MHKVQREDGGKRGGRRANHKRVKWTDGNEQQKDSGGPLYFIFINKYT